MLIAHLSDLHIAGPNKKAYGLAPTAENLRLAIRHLNQVGPTPDLELITGDITYHGSSPEVSRAAKILQELDFPYYLVPGNHDQRSTLWAEFGNTAIPGQESEFMNYTIEGHDIRLIGMDSTAPGEPGGAMDSARCSWLEERLAEEPNQPTVIFMHHPPVQYGVLETDEDGFAGVQLLADVVARYDNIERILCGHIHLEAHAGWCNTVVSTAPSMELQLSLDLTLTRPSEFYLASPGYQLHYLHPAGHLVSHTVFVRRLSGPFPFEEWSGDENPPTTQNQQRLEGNDEQ